MSSSHFIDLALTAAFRYRYLLLFFGTIVEGPIITVACGFLLRLGVFNFLLMFLAVSTGDLVGDIVWYYVGRFFLEPFLRRHGHFLSVTPEVMERAKKLFHRYHARSLFISKVTMGFGMPLATLMVAGASRVPFRRYMTLNALGEIIYVSFLLALGYFFGHAYTLVANGFRWLFIAAASGVAIALIFGVSRYARHRLLNT